MDSSNSSLYLTMGFFVLSNISCSNKYVIPNPNEVLIEHGAFRDNSLKTQLRILVWNIAKGKKDGFASDFRRISQGADIILIQEYLHPEKNDQVLFPLDSMLFKIAIAFRYKKNSAAAGVATGSTAKPVETIPLVSDGREPFIHTPKTTLITIYDVANFEANLMIVNIHGLNRTSYEAYKRQFEMVKQKIEDHKGPVLFGGDFNTNSKKKRDYVKQITGSLELSEVGFTNDSRKRSKLSRIPLDYIFTRGLKILNSHVYGNLKGSDHKAMMLECEIVN